MAAGMEEEGFTEDSIEGNMGGIAKSFEVLINGLLNTLG